MKILKFGGTSIGTAARLKALLPVINQGGRKIVVLSAMAGTTNILESVCSLLYKGMKKEASAEIDKLHKQYMEIVSLLLSDRALLEEGIDLINVRFEYIRDFSLRVFSPKEEKTILAQGELVSTALFMLYCREQNVRASLLPALNFMRIDKDGEPDYYYIKENLQREL